jgi:chromosomal replication initiator protein
MSRPNGYLVAATDDLAPRVIAETARAFNLTPADLTGRSVARRVSRARHVAMAVLREASGLSLPKIGEIFDRDHATVHAAFDRHAGDPEFRSQVQAVLAELGETRPVVPLQSVVQPERLHA